MQLCCSVIAFLSDNSSAAVWPDLSSISKWCSLRYYVFSCYFLNEGCRILRSVKVVQNVLPSTSDMEVCETVTIVCIALFYLSFWGLTYWRVRCFSTQAWATQGAMTVDAEGQMARFVTKSWEYVVDWLYLTYCTWEQRLLLLSLERWPLIIKKKNTDYMHKSSYISFLEIQVICSVPTQIQIPKAKSFRWISIALGLKGVWHSTYYSEILNFDFETVSMLPW